MRDHVRDARRILMLNGMPGPQAAHVLRHPGAFALLSIGPLPILIVIALSHVIDQAEPLQTIGRYPEWLVPGQSQALVCELGNFFEHRQVMSWVLPATMLFFGSLAFTVLENAMSVISQHRVAIRRRHFLISAVLPYCDIVSLAVGLLLYRIGVTGEVFIVVSISMVMPVGRLRLSRALVGAVVAAVPWEITRHVLVWYFATLSQIGMVYGSLTTASALLPSLEPAATLLLLGAQAIAESERPGSPHANAEPEPMRLGAD